jgi:N-acetylglucosamine-6-phosphate deacetylase
MTIRYITAPRLFDGHAMHERAALVVENGRVRAVIPAQEVPAGSPSTILEEGFLAPGFVDLQVNGGGGVLLNDDPSVKTIRTICAAHRPFGTTALLPTLITDRPEVTAAAIAAAIAARKTREPGCVGLHLEGPHLCVERCGAHDPDLIRPMSSADLQQLIDAKAQLKTLMMTLAPESVTIDQVQHLVAAGIVVSIGHTNASYDTARAYFSAGARVVTHLFNAMSPLGNREPGLVGALLDTGPVAAGVIADGIHVHYATLAMAARAKARPGPLFLVTDAMASLGSNLQSFLLNGRRVQRQNGRLTLEDGTLAGADIDMVTCVRNAWQHMGINQAEALRMAGLHPASVIGRDGELGSLRPGSRALFVHLSDELQVIDSHDPG